MSLGGRHGHTIRRLRRRMDVVLEEERERRKPAPPPISEEHAAMRERIQRMWGAMLVKAEQAVEGKDLDDAVREDPELLFDAAVMEDLELGNDAAKIIVLMREEAEFLARQGVDPRPWSW